MTASVVEIDGPGDPDLIATVRAGASGAQAAFGTLYERHVVSARNLARQLARDSAAADDLVADAFAKVLDALRLGGGPDAAFRTYLLTTLRNAAYDRTRRDQRLRFTEDVTDLDPPTPFRDPVIAQLERSLAARAFARLPQRWQTVLWHTEIEGQSPAEIAVILGMTANSVSALAYRAREGLRQAYLQVYLADGAARRCRAAVDRLGAWTRDGLSKRESLQVEAHLDDCARCRALAAELADVSSAMGGIIAPIVLGAGTTGYLALIGKSVTLTATTGAVGAAGAAATAGPRQWLTAAASTGALAAAVLIALLSGPGPQPVAAAPPAPTVGATHTTPPRHPQPRGPEPAPRPTPRPAPTTEAPAAEPAALQVDGSATVTLTPGGAARLPITVRNSGGSVSEPVTVSLNLPAGVTASGPDQASPERVVSPGITVPQAVHTEQSPARPTTGTTGSTPAITCAGGTGTISCRTDRGLRPTESITFDFTLLASSTATGGQVTGRVNGGAIDLELAPITLVVTTPRPVDSLALRTGIWHQWPWSSRLDVIATNTGTSTGLTSVTVRTPEGTHAIGLPPICRGRGPVVTCTATLAPGRRLRGSVWLHALHGPGGPTRVEARLGEALVTREVSPSSWGLPSARPPILDQPVGQSIPRPVPSTPLTATPRPSTSPATTTPAPSPTPSRPAARPSPSRTTPADPTPTSPAPSGLTSGGSAPGGLDPDGILDLILGSG